MVFQIWFDLFFSSSESYLSVSSCTMVFQIWFDLFFSSSESISSRARGLMRMDREIFISSSTCSLDLDISLRASMAGPVDFLPPSFCAASISCLFLSSSSICFFFASLLLCCKHLLPLPLIFLHLLLLCLPPSVLQASLASSSHLPPSASSLPVPPPPSSPALPSWWRPASSPARP